MKYTHEMNREYLTLSKSRAKPKEIPERWALEITVLELSQKYTRWYNRFETLCCVQTTTECYVGAGQNQNNLPFFWKRGGMLPRCAHSTARWEACKGRCLHSSDTFHIPNSVALLPHLLRSLWPVLPLVLGSRPFFSSFQILIRMRACRKKRVELIWL